MIKLVERGPPEACNSLLLCIVQHPSFIIKVRLKRNAGGSTINVYCLENDQSASSLSSIFLNAKNMAWRVFALLVGGLFGSREC